MEDVADSISSVVRETGFSAGNQLPQICVCCAITVALSVEKHICSQTVPGFARQKKQVWGRQPRD